jgi:hypothetical protein
MLSLQGERNKEGQGSKHKSRPKDREDFSHVFDGNNSYLSEKDNDDDDDDDEEPSEQSRGRAAKKAKVNTLERVHEGEVEKIRSTMRRLATEF